MNLIGSLSPWEHLDVSLFLGALGSKMITTCLVLRLKNALQKAAGALITSHWVWSGLLFAVPLDWSYRSIKTDGQSLVFMTYINKKESYMWLLDVSLHETLTFVWFLRLCQSIIHKTAGDWWDIRGLSTTHYHTYLSETRVYKQTINTWKGFCYINAKSLHVMLM